LNRMLGALALTLLLVSFAPYLHAQWWIFELPGHFRPHMAVAAAAIGLLTALRKLPLVLATSLVVFTHSAVLLLSVPAEPLTQSPTVTLVSQNLYRGNDRFDRFAGLLGQEDPDIVVLQEYTPEWHAALSEMAKRYQARITVPQVGAFGIAMFSKLPITHYEIIRLDDVAIPFIVAQFDAPRFSAQLIAVHFASPVKRESHYVRAGQIEMIKTYLQDLDMPYVLIGDFNNTPASQSMRNLTGDAGAHPATPHWLPTWPSPLGWAGIPIDFAVGSSDVRFGNLERLPEIGSDHRGIRVSVAIENQTNP